MSLAWCGSGAYCQQAAYIGVGLACPCQHLPMQVVHIGQRLPAFSTTPFLLHLFTRCYLNFMVRLYMRP